MSAHDKQFWLSKVALLRGHVPPAVAPAWPVTIAAGDLLELAAAIERDILKPDLADQLPANPARADLPSLHGKIEWRTSEDDKELTLFQNGCRVGAISVWTDDKTHEPAWWCGVLALAAGDQDVPGFHNTEDEAKAAVIRAVAARAVEQAEWRLPP